MNTIEEILKKKSNETIFETYKRELCTKCANRNNNKDLCRITVTLDKKARCTNYERCMKN